LNAYDVIVLGLGGMGSAAAYHLAARGQRVLGLEQFSPPHDRGSSHGRTRVIRQAYFEHPAYVPLLLRAYEHWKLLEQVTDQQLLLLPGGLMMGSPNSEVVSGSITSARQHGLPHEVLDVTDIRRRVPQFRIRDDTVGVFEAAAGLVFCERAVSAHLDAASRAGAVLQFNEPVLGWHATADGSGVTVTTARGRYSATQLVITPGPWAPQLLSDLGIPLLVERQVLFWFQPPGGVDAFTPNRFPIYIWQRDDGATPYGFPSLDGTAGGVKIAFYRKAVSEPCTPEIRRPPNPRRRYRRDAGCPPRLSTGGGWRACPGRDLPLHAHAGSQFHHWPASAACPGKGGGRVQWARLQVLQRGGGNPEQPGRHGPRRS
jgi:sarcosine oxidase